MPIYDSPFANLMLGIASIKRPQLLEYAFEEKKRAADEERRKRDDERQKIIDEQEREKFNAWKRSDEAKTRFSGLLSTPEESKGMTPSLLYGKTPEERKGTMMGTGLLAGYEPKELGPLLGTSMAPPANYGLNPILGEDENGNPVIMQMSSQGGALKIATPPPGVRPTSSIDWVNSGGGYTPVPTRSSGGRMPPAVEKTLPPEQALSYIEQRGRTEAAVKRDSSMEGINKIIGEAEDALKGIKRDVEGNIIQGRLPTQSGVGTVIDKAGALVGYSAPGAEEAAALRAAAAALTGKMPRFEGPQSEADRKYYIEMAGQVGDSTVPIPTRVAALEVVKRLWGKYGPDDRQSGRGASGTWDKAPKGLPVWEKRDGKLVRVR